MKKWIVVFTLLVCFSLEAQDTISLNMDSNVIELQFDTLPAFTFFNPEEVEGYNFKSRIAALHNGSNTKNIYFLILLLFSVILTWVLLNSKDLVKSSIKSIQSIQHTVQFSRADRQSNSFYFVLYAFLFMLGLSLAVHFIGREFYHMNQNLFTFSILVFGIFFLDYLFSYFYLLFSNGAKTLELIQAVILNYAIILCLVMWPLLFFIILASLGVAKLFSIILLTIIAVILLIKELRVLQVLYLEKINIFSFHFFTYLCTFKFLPIIVLVKVILQ